MPQPQSLSDTAEAVERLVANPDQSTLLAATDALHSVWRAIEKELRRNSGSMDTALKIKIREFVALSDQACQAAEKISELKPHQKSWAPTIQENRNKAQAYAENGREQGLLQI